MKYLPPAFSRTEYDDMKQLALISPASGFAERILIDKEDYTDVLIDECEVCLNGDVPKNFVLNMRGKIGRQTGIFKSSTMIQLGLLLFPDFNLQENLAFTMYDIEKKIKDYATRKQFFIIDEQVRDLKKAQEMRIANIIDSCREKQICFGLVGVPEQYITFSDYYLERLGESDDKFLPEKTVYYMVKKIFGGRDSYRGLFKRNITPLTDGKWGKLWREYMKLKTEHQERAINCDLTGFNFREYGDGFMKTEDFKACMDRDKKSGVPVLKKGLLKNALLSNFSDYTNENRESLRVYITHSFEKTIEKNFL